MAGAVTRCGEEFELRSAVAKRREGFGCGSDTREDTQTELERATDDVTIAIRRHHQASARGMHPIYLGGREHRARADQARRAVRLRQQSDGVERPPRAPVGA